MTAKVTSFISIFMSLVSGGALLALVKQLQFLDLTSEVAGVPTAYQYFSAHTKNVDIPDPREYVDIDLDWMGKYSPEAVQTYAMKEFAKAKAIARWCAAREEETMAKKAEAELKKEEAIEKRRE